MKTAILQLNPKVGDIVANTVALMAAYTEAANAGADLVVAPECVLTGYPLEDLVLRKSFMAAVVEQVALIEQMVRANPGDAVLIYGAPYPTEDGTAVTNSAFVVDPKGITERVDKYELPNYGVFDEKRHFVGAKNQPRTVNIHGYKVGLMICEDCWFPTVSRELSNDGAVLLISINGSPFEIGKNVTRRQVVAKRIKETGLPFLYVNMVGGQDELVFDGGSFFFDGYAVQEAPHYVAGTSYFDIDLPYKDRHTAGGKMRAVIRDDGSFSHWKDDRALVHNEGSDTYTLPEASGPPVIATVANYPKVEPTGVADVYQIAVLGLRDYLRKQGFQKVVLGYSGGVDSGLVAAIACDAIGPENVLLVRLPSKFSSEGSLTDAAEGARRLGCAMRTIKIEPVVLALRNAYKYAIDDTGFGPEAPFPDAILTGAADENIQARARGNILMSISNQEGYLLLTTGNKSEVSVGYATLYGDMSGGFNPIKDFYKTMVWAACRWRNQVFANEIPLYGFLGKGGIDVVPEEIIVKPPSAELRENQQDSDSLPLYPVLDAILDGMVERELSSAEIVAEGIADEATVKRIRHLLDMAEYKRRQAAPGVKITSKIYGRDRRYPIINGWRG